MKIATLKTSPIQDPDTLELGFFEAEVTIPDYVFLADPDKAGLVKTAVARKLAALVLDFGTTPELYTAFIDPAIQKGLNFPATINLGNR